MEKERISVNLHKAIYELMKSDDKVVVLGEDVAEPYGGAFKITKNFSKEFPSRVINTPISEEGFVNMATGMALMGYKPIVDMMFSDFITLAFDPLVNFASKSVTMYGKKLDISMIIRTANGGYRGYGATHSQSMQKYFMGIPNLSVYEMSPFHENAEVFSRMLGEKRPCVFFEEKILYVKYLMQDGMVNDLFEFHYIGEQDNWAVTCIDYESNGEFIIITHGGLSYLCLEAMEQLILEDEIEGKLLVPSKLYPFELAEIESQIGKNARILIVEEGTEGASWGESMAYHLMQKFYDRGVYVEVLSSKDSIIPASRNLENEVLVSKEDVCSKVKELIMK